MRRSLLLITAAMLALTSCSAEFGLGMSEVAVPSQPCVPASEMAISAVAARLHSGNAALVAAYMVRVPLADRGFGQYPSFIFAGRLVSLSDESGVGTWSLGDDASFGPIYPLDETAMLLTDRGQFQPESLMADHLAMLSASASASTAQDCAQGGTSDAG